MARQISTSGYYWFFTLDSEGNPLETTPNVFYYSEEKNEVLLIGYDLPLPYNSSNYRVLRKLQYD